MTPPPSIRLHRVREHNLRDVSVAIPHGRLTVVTGVSGSGKSSLVFDTLHAASERRYLETLSSHARRFLQRLPSPDVEQVEALSPSIALGQRRGNDNPRSTVGTLSGIYGLLRFWFAAETDLEARDFSFVSAGACPSCRGFGSEDEVMRDLLVADPSKSLRQGALVPTTPTGYIVYSQVTVDALDTVCKAHGFSVDMPWQELTAEQQDVVFFGSDRVTVPFGKHPLESRMRWQGITAKPRELGHYKGLIPTIADILRRSRNENALRFARSVPCSACSGSRLGDRARRARIGDVSIAQASSWPLPRLRQWVAEAASAEIAAPLERRIRVLERLGLQHLSCDRSAMTLSGGEHQRLRLGTIATAGLSGVTFVFDEPSIGLHASEEQAVLELLHELRDAGNTVVVVEHSESAMLAADYLIDLGPGAGQHGGRVLFAGTRAQWCADADARDRMRVGSLRERLPVGDDGFVEVRGAHARNLRDIDVRFASARLNAVTGVAGAGKSTLVSDVLVAAVRARLDGRPLPGGVRELRGAEPLRQIVHVDQAPIGRTPRSNPATYTGLFDEVRKCFADVPAAKTAGFKATTFSFNTKQGGRCPTCEGSGREVIGMHGLPEVELVCGACSGRRFREDVLGIRYGDGHTILDVLDTTVDDARQIFFAEPKILRVLDALHRVGLGYLTLGQPATTLSGGEAQRVKLAGELARGSAAKNTLFVLEEPTIGLHRRDIAVLLRALDELVRQGSTVVLVEHDLDVIRAADHIIDLGPGAGEAGGVLCGMGTSEQIAELDTPTGRCLRAGPATAPEPTPEQVRPPIELRGVATHNLADLDIDLPSSGLTVVTGVSGSGKSSLVFDTLFGESRARFTEHLQGHLQRQLSSGGARARTMRSASGLRPTIALAQRAAADGGVERRSTVATTAELHPLLRTLWSRLASVDPAAQRLPAEAFSFFRREGACPDCGGVGTVLRCDPERLISDPGAPLWSGGLDTSNKVVRDYAAATGRHAAILRAVGVARGHDYDQPWCALTDQARDDAMRGCGDDQFDAVWEHTGAEGGEPHRWRAKWPGIAGDIDREYARRQESGTTSRAREFEQLLAPRNCSACHGDRLREPARSVRVAGRTLPELCRMEVAALLDLVRAGMELDQRSRAIAMEGIGEVERRLVRLVQLGLGHLQLDRGMASLSAGERQRLRLARQLAAPLYGCVYVLDEPTLGLHPRDTAALLDVVRGLVAAGNAVIAVEHDLAVAAAADHVIEVGPGAGLHGGRIVAAGAPAELSMNSRTGRRLHGEASRVPRARSRNATERWLRIERANLHHLHDIDVEFPMACLTAVTGVSGSGKTTLLRGVLANSARTGRGVGCSAVHGLDAFAGVIEDAGARAGRSRTGCPAILLGIFDEIRRQFASTVAAKANGWRASHFAYLGKSGGACKPCGGLGRVRSEFDFAGTGLWLVCDECDGLRYDPATRAVRWVGELSIADVLMATVEQLVARLGDELAKWPKLARPLQAAEQLGLGYLQLGQGADTLSGGEAQRLSLAVHLAMRTEKPSLFLLDEPTRGLHPDDVDALLAALDQLLQRGHTIVAVEHDLELIAHADHVVDLGPGAGAVGGRVVFAGTPSGLTACRESATGACLRPTTASG